MKSVVLHGSLTQFGHSFDLEVTSAAQATRALIANLGEEFGQAIRRGVFHVIYGDPKAETPQDLDETQLTMGTSANEIHIIPAIEGSSGALRTVLGIVMVIAGTFFQQPWLVKMGVAMALGGIATLLTPTPKASQQSNVAQNPSFVFNGAVNTIAQGGPIPIVYGRFRTGSVVISAGLETAEIPTADAGGVTPDGAISTPTLSLQAKN